RTGDECVVCPFATLLACHETGVDQFLHVMAHGGLTDPEVVREVAHTHGAAALCCDVGKQTESNRISESLQDDRHTLCTCWTEWALDERAALTSLRRGNALCDVGRVLRSSKCHDLIIH